MDLSSLYLLPACPHIFSRAGAVPALAKALTLGIKKLEETSQP
jgi:hypothetical protein